MTTFLDLSTYRPTLVREALESVPRMDLLEPMLTFAGPVIAPLM